MSKHKNPTPNDQRSNTKNPERPEHKAAQDNRANQMNPQRPNSPAPAMPTGGGMPGGNNDPMKR
ncbi:hypothetical protein [Corallococcus llansteffanensis]|uniref:Uncharacterized protein n=1 Tax=Corallococcus llansteffanensis TaxID=2316731 RepID=A0A3A8Q035_9BACT|nr:hypothetical protein [Corallococcus llansteffanensis]RKH62106.1 hypothetical protein D7V93_10665 [Corallococcus llansteffanensis]